MRAREVKHAPTTAYADLICTLLHCMRQDGAAAAAHAQALIAVAREHGLVTQSAFGSFLEPWSRWHLAKSKAVLNEMRAGIATCREHAIGIFVPFFAATLADAEAQAGERDAALATIDGVIADIERGGQRWCEAEASHPRRDFVEERSVEYGARRGSPPTIATD